MDERGIPDVVTDGWLASGDARALAAVEEVSADVSTNRVYRLSFDDGSHAIAKASSYGSFVHFRQDHQRIHRWIELLRPTRWEGFLADVVCKDGEVFMYRDGPAWAAFYDEIERRESLPRCLPEADIAELARELAEFRGLALEGLEHLGDHQRLANAGLCQGDLVVGVYDSHPHDEVRLEREQAQRRGAVDDVRTRCGGDGGGHRGDGGRAAAPPTPEGSSQSTAIPTGRRRPLRRPPSPSGPRPVPRCSGTPCCSRCPGTADRAAERPPG